MRSNEGMGLRTGVLAASLLVAGGLHLALTGEHAEESTTLGIGFVIAGMAQIVLGFWSLRGGRGVYGAIIGLNAVLIALYAMHVTTGLPLPDAKAGADEMRGLLGSREAIEPLALITKLAEVVGIALAIAGARARVAVHEREIYRRAA